MSESVEYYKLTHSQKGIWYTEKLYPGTSIGNIAGTLKINSKIDHKLLEKAILAFIEKNDALNIRFTEIDGEPYQYLSAKKCSSIDFLDFSSSGRHCMYEWDTRQTQKPFELIDSCLFYFAVLKISENESGFYFKIHHLIADGWSIVLTGNEIVKYYTYLENGEPVSEEVKPSYLEFIEKEKEYENSTKFLKDKEFWENMFSTVPEVTALKTRTTISISTKARRKTQIIPDKLSTKIQEYCSENKISVFALYLSALAIYINRVTGKEDLVIGIPVLNRANTREKDTIGMFISTVPLRISVEDSLNFKQFSEMVLKNWVAVLKHHKYPYDLLLKGVREKFRSNDELYDIVLSYQNARFVRSEFSHKHEGRWHFNGHQKQSLYIHLNDREDEGNLVIDYDFLSDLFCTREIDFIQDHITRLLWHALDNPFKQISKIDMISENEKNKMLYEFNKTELEYKRDLTIHELFESQVKRTPDNIAAVFHNNHLTYRELNNKAEKVADLLRSKGAGTDKIIGIAAERSLEMLIGILGILKAGAAYLPIDPSYPKDRIIYMLEDSKADILLEYGSKEVGFQFKGDIISLDNILERDSNNYANEKESVKKRPIQCTPNSLAYVIYTSGSTGKPKGVMIEHRSVVNFIAGIRDIIDFSEGRSILSVTTVSFDIFVLETIHSLCCGLKVVIADENEQKIPILLNKLINEYDIEMLQTTPSRINMILEDADSAKCFSKLSTLMIGGEAFPELLLKKLTNMTNARIYNMYGPTETTVWSTVKELTGLKNINIGRPIANTQVYILDKMMQPVPIGFCGELYIGGDGLARGYINMPELTKERFIQNPFAPGKKIYRTGDLARWFPKGEIEHLGRADFQLKIRGFRIEPGEIESRLMEYSGITAAAVVDKVNADGIQYLCAYIISETEPKIKVLRNFLLKKLPGYMVPAHFIRVDRIPLTPNGKIDKKTLREMKNETLEEKAEKLVETIPLNDTEFKLKSICMHILKNNELGIDDSFFESGGDSLSTLTLAACIQKDFKVNVPVDIINKLMTIREIAKYITEKANYSEYVIPKAEMSEYYPVSSSQKRIFILGRIDRNKLSYNMPFALEVDGKLNKENLEKAVNILVERHEALRTSFGMEDDKPVMRILPSLRLKLENSKAETDNIDVISKDFIKPFDLGKAPLIRFKLASITDMKNVLLIDMHHIISDRASVNILIKELLDIYLSNPLPEINLQYKDFSVYQKNRLRSELILKQKEYWVKQFDGDIPVLNMPIDFQRPEEQSFEGGKVNIVIDREAYGNLKMLAYKNNATMFMVLTAIYNVLLSKYCGQEDIIIGTPVSTRNTHDLEATIGMFVNTIALRNKPVADKNFVSFIAEVRENTIAALANQDYPFEELINNLKVPRDLSRNPLFSTMLIYNKNDFTGFDKPDLKIKPIIINNGISKFDLTLEVNDDGKKLELVFEFCKALFKKKTIKEFAKNFVDLLNAAENPNIRIGDMCIGTPVNLKNTADKTLLQISKELNTDCSCTSPSNIIEKRLVEVWSEVLSLNADQISIYDNFFELGGDSLSVILVQAKLAKYNWKLATQEYYKNQTVKQLAQRVIPNLVNCENEVSSTLEVSRKRLDNIIDISNLPERGIKHTGFKTVFLTGVTGYLGIHILCYLIDIMKVNVFCLIRGDNKELCEKRLSDLMDFYFGGKYKDLIGNRIQVICGDIGVPGMSIDKSTLNLLGEKIDAIVHSAAVVKHYGDYDMFNRINVEGTKHIVNFALKFGITLFHVSTMSVSGAGFSNIEGALKNDVFCEKDFDIGQNYWDNLYVESKFKAENLVFEAIMSGLDAYVLRMGNLTGRYIDGGFQKNIEENAFYNKLKAIIGLCSAPENIYKTEIEFTPVDYAGRAVVDIIRCENKKGRVFHLYNPGYISFDSVIKILSDLDMNIDVVSENDFRNKLLTSLNDSEKASSLLMLMQDFENNGGNFPDAIIRTDNTITCTCLKNMGFNWPIVDNNYIYKIIEYARQVGFLN